MTRYGKSPSRSSKGGGRSGARHQGTAQKRRRTAAPPELQDGQVRCPVCRNAVRTTAYGYLRAHRDLFGLDCYNKRPPELEAPS